MLPAQPNQSLMDGMACLQCLATRSCPIGVRELARQLGLEPNRANRLLKTLAHLGFTRQTAERKYEPGPAIHVLLAQCLVGSNLLRRTRPRLQALHAAGYDCALGVLWGTEVCYLYHGRADQGFGDGFGRTGLYPATRSAIGLVLLATLPAEDAAARYQGREIPGFSDAAGLMRALLQVRGDGYARVLTATKPRDLAFAVSLGDPTEAALAVFGNITRPREAMALTALRGALDGV